MRIIEDLIYRARRRLILNETLGQAAFAAAVAAGGFALILFLGTRYLAWWTIAPLAGLAFAIGAAKILRRIPGPYAIAQRLDNTAGLHDSLSTAIHFRFAAVANTLFRDSQQVQAESAARGVDLSAAIPYRFPRALYPFAALSLLASGLVVLRYSLTRSLDLRAPLTEVLFEDQLARREMRHESPAAAKSFKALKAAESLMAKLNSPASPDQRQDPDALDQAIDQALAPPSPANSDKSQKSDQAGKTGDQKNANALDANKNGDPLDGNENSSPSATQDGKSPESQQNGASNENNKSNNSSDGSNSSLLSKLKDAVSNMFSRSRQDGSQGQKSASQQPGQMAKSDRRNAENKSGGKGEQQGQAQSDAQEGDPNGDPQEGQQADGKNGAKTSAQNSAQAGSGIGSQDGAKDLRAAAQLKAMGKISEIIGKRAATVSGETMIEVQSGNQQLKTAYTDRTAAHADADSDVSRDEIPPALQSYVANYFDQVRKPASGKPPHNPSN